MGYDTEETDDKNHSQQSILAVLLFLWEDSAHGLTDVCIVFSSRGHLQPTAFFLLCARQGAPTINSNSKGGLMGETR